MRPTPRRGIYMATVKVSHHLSLSNVVKALTYDHDTLNGVEYDPAEHGVAIHDLTRTKATIVRRVRRALLDEGTRFLYQGELTASMEAAIDARVLRYWPDFAKTTTRTA